MPAGIGYSFSPFQEDSQGQQPPAEQVQNAIQVLGLRMPTVAGARGIAPQPLLNSQGMGGLNIPPGLSIEQFFQWLFGQTPNVAAGQVAQAGGGPSRGGAGPVPGITPGTTPQAPASPGQPVTGSGSGAKIPGDAGLPLVPSPGAPNPPMPSMPTFDPGTPTADRSTPLPGNRGSGGPLMRPYPMGFQRR